MFFLIFSLYILRKKTPIPLHRSKTFTSISVTKSRKRLLYLYIGLKLMKLNKLKSLGKRLLYLYTVLKRFFSFGYYLKNTYALLFLLKKCCLKLKKTLRCNFSKGKFDVAEYFFSAKLFCNITKITKFSNY